MKRKGNNNNKHIEQHVALQTYSTVHTRLDNRCKDKDKHKTSGLRIA